MPQGDELPVLLPGAHSTPFHSTAPSITPCLDHSFLPDGADVAQCGHSCTDCCIREYPALFLLGPRLQLQRAHSSLSPFSGCDWTGELSAAKPRPQTLHFSVWQAAQLQVFPVEARVSCCSRVQAFISLVAPRWNHPQLGESWLF